jgi:hypothetical protein
MEPLYVFREMFHTEIVDLSEIFVTLFWAMTCFIRKSCNNMWSWTVEPIWTRMNLIQQLMLRSSIQNFIEINLGDETSESTDRQADRHYFLILCSLYKEQMVTTDLRSRVGSTPASYTEGPRSNLGPQHVRMWTGLFCLRVGSGVRFLWAW